MAKSPQHTNTGSSRKWSRSYGASWLMLVGIVFLNALPTQADPPPPVERVEIRTEGLYVNGKPFFPVGIGWVGHGHYSLPEAGEKGFNLAITHGQHPPRINLESWRSDIDEAYANGMYAMASVGNGVWEDLEVLEQIVMACRDAPGLLVWELEDEPNIRVSGPEGVPNVDRPYRVPPERFKPAYDLIKRLDPLHPVYINLGYGYLKDHQDYRDVADIHSGDVYPVPVFTLNHVAEYSDSVMKGAVGKLGWMWIQMAPVQGVDFLRKSNIPDRAPTIVEVRCMTYMAVTRGISGVTYFAFHYREKGRDWWINQSTPAYWSQWADLTAELRLLAPYLLAPEVPGLVSEIIEGSKPSRRPTWDGSGELGYTALHLSLRQTDSGYFLIAVNGLNSPIKARFKVPVPDGGLAADGASVRSEHRLVAVENGVFEDSFEPYAVHLYEIPFKVKFTGHPATESPSWPRWQRRPRP
jgi:hypothetical protein